MAKNTVTSKDTIKQENDIAMGAHTRLKRPERPPVFLVSAGSQVVENPSSVDIADEINMTIMAPIRVIYEYAMADDGGDNHFPSPKGVAAIANTLFTALERWEHLARYL